MKNEEVRQITRSHAELETRQQELKGKLGKGVVTQRGRSQETPGGRSQEGPTLAEYEELKRRHPTESPDQLTKRYARQKNLEGVSEGREGGEGVQLAEAQKSGERQQESEGVQSAEETKSGGQQHSQEDGVGAAKEVHPSGPFGGKPPSGEGYAGDLLEDNSGRVCGFESPAVMSPGSASSGSSQGGRGWHDGGRWGGRNRGYYGRDGYQQGTTEEGEGEVTGTTGAGVTSRVTKEEGKGEVTGTRGVDLRTGGGVGEDMEGGESRVIREVLGRLREGVTRATEEESTHTGQSKRKMRGLKRR